jgi:putative PIN family toxin of toxin-antitoxin system
MSNLRVVLDTNVLLSGLAYPTSIPGRIVHAWRGGAIDVILSRYILDETARSLPRMPPIRMSQDEVRNLVDSLVFMIEIVEPSTVTEETLRDEADLPILGTLLAAQADYLITGDEDLLVLREKYSIIAPAEFWEKHGG